MHRRTDRRLYVLDFVDIVDLVAPLHVPIGVFILHPEGTSEITPQDLPDEVLRTIVFACRRSVYGPVIC